jgi:hypothetical protein
MVGAEDLGILEAASKILLHQPFGLAGRSAGEDAHAAFLKQAACAGSHALGYDDVGPVFDEQAGDDTMFMSGWVEAADGTMAFSVDVEDEKVIGVAEVAGHTIIADGEGNAHSVRPATRCGLHLVAD